MDSLLISPGSLRLRPGPAVVLAAALALAIAVLLSPAAVMAREGGVTFGCDPGPSRPEQPPAPADSVEVDPTLTGAFLLVDGNVLGPPLHGVGLNLEPTLWSCQQSHPYLLSTLLDALRPALVRVGITQAPWAPEGTEDVTQLDRDSYWQVLDSPAYQPSWEFLSELNRRGIALLLAHWGAPGVMTDDGTPMGRLLPENFERYADYYETAVEYLVVHRGLKVLAVSAMNEPDCGDGSKVPAEEYPRLVRILGERLAPYGVGLYGPDTCSADSARDYLDALLADPEALSYLTLIGIHQYRAGDDVRRLVEYVRAAGLDLPVYITEYTSFGYGALDDGQQANDELGFLLDTVAILQSHLQGGADAALYWDGVDYLQVHHSAITRWGLLSGPKDDPPFAPRKRYWGMRQIMPFLPPGARLLGTLLDGPPGLLALAALGPPEERERATVVLINTGSPVELDLVLRDLPFGPGFLNVYRTSAIEDMAYLGVADVSGGVLSISLPARSITTLTQYPLDGAEF